MRLWRPSFLQIIGYVLLSRELGGVNHNILACIIFSNGGTINGRLNLMFVKMVADLHVEYKV